MNLLQHDLSSPVKTDSSFWTIEDDVLHITLQKRDKDQTWSSPIQGQGQLDPYAADLEQKRLMLQKFQEEVDLRRKGGEEDDGYVFYFNCSKGNIVISYLVN
ncbi:putative CS domain, HSP20-like chaperone, NudC family [Helianthus annuus]|nr:putative CS domain, HSP20-like chaperone, NudC family [Helianthus annuus]